MSDNIVEIGCRTKLDIPVERILGKAQEKDLECVVVVGLTKEGHEYFASSTADGGDCIYWLQRAIWSLNKMADELSNGDASV